jgi:predicted N-acetyltransferase YhbS
MVQTTLARTDTDITVRPLRESDLPEADRILRSAFNTFLAVPDLFGDKDYVRTRWQADPRAALAADRDGRLVGSNFITGWGSVGFFGPLSVRPELWDQGVASRLMETTVQTFDACDVRHAGLFTFPHSPKHLGLYAKFGFRPRFLTPVMVRPNVVPTTAGGFHCYSQLPSDQRRSAVDACRALTNTAYAGLDLSREIHAVRDQQLGDVVLLDDTDGLAAMAICHLGPGTEGGGGGCYVKFGIARPGPKADARFDALLAGCEALAAERGATHVELGVNTAREEAYAAVTARAYRAVMVGVTMHRGDDAGYSRRGTWVVDDWR